MKKIFAILMSIAVLLHCFIFMAIYTGFELNRDYIAKNLCINRNHPELHCDGKCQLCKRLKAEQKQETKGLPDLKNLKQILLFSLQKDTFKPFSADLSACNHSGYIFSLSTLHKQAIFHPPVV